jgi:hypothetical protein
MSKKTLKRAGAILLPLAAAITISAGTAAAEEGLAGLGPESSECTPGLCAEGDEGLEGFSPESSSADDEWDQEAFEAWYFG